MTAIRSSCRRRKRRSLCWSASCGSESVTSHGERVVVGQRLMQAASDIFLGWQDVEGYDGVVRDFYIRQLFDWKGSVDVDDWCRAARTSTHTSAAGPGTRAFPGGRPVAIAAYLGSSDRFDSAIADFSFDYADQNDRDYQAFVDAASGRIEASTTA